MPNGTNKRRGPEPDLARAFNRELLSQWSDRTFARYWRAIRLLKVTGTDPRPLIEKFTRPNGSMNVAALLQTAEDIFAAWYVLNEDEINEINRANAS